MFKLGFTSVLCALTLGLACAFSRAEEAETPNKPTETKPPENPKKPRKDSKNSKTKPETPEPEAAPTPPVAVPRKPKAQAKPGDPEFVPNPIEEEPVDPEVAKTEPKKTSVLTPPPPVETAPTKTSDPERSPFSELSKGEDPLAAPEVAPLKKDPPPVAPVLANKPDPTDPEFVRAPLNEAPEEAVEPAFKPVIASLPVAAPRAGDPEERRFALLDPDAPEDARPAKPENTKPVAAAPSAKLVDDDTPRFAAEDNPADALERPTEVAMVPKAEKTPRNKKIPDEDKKIALEKDGPAFVQAKYDKLKIKEQNDALPWKDGKDPKDLDPVEHEKRIRDWIELQNQKLQNKIEEVQQGNEPVKPGTANDAAEGPASKIPPEETAEAKNPVKDPKSSKDPKKKDEPDITSQDPHATRALVAMKRQPMGVIRGKVVDGKTLKPICARVCARDLSNTVSSSRIPDVGFWVFGDFAIPVIAGPVDLEISAGPFRSRFHDTVTVPVGNKGFEITAKLSTPANREFSRQGWWPADLNLGLRASREYQPLWLGDAPELEDASVAARAEGVQILGLGMPYGDPGQIADPERVIPLMENASDRELLIFPTFPGPRNPFLGSCYTFALTDWKRLPQVQSDPQEPLRDLLDDLRTQGAFTVLDELSGRRVVDPKQAVYPVFPKVSPLQISPRDPGAISGTGFFQPNDRSARLYAPAELPFDIVSGQGADALAFDGSESAQNIWFNLLNEGYSIPVVGPGGSSLQAGRIPAAQTFLRADPPVTREKIVAALREGRSSVSFGPVVIATLDERDKGPGDRLPADGRPCRLKVRAYAALLPTAKISQVDIIRNGVVIRSEMLHDGFTEIEKFEQPIAEKHDAWYVVRVAETLEPSARNNLTKPIMRWAWTNPIYFDTIKRAAPQPARTRMHGTLKDWRGNPCGGAAVVLEPGQDERSVKIGADGQFDFSMLAAGLAVFSAPGHEPASRRPFEDARVQKALGALVTERESQLVNQLAKPTLFGYWRLALSELDGDVDLKQLKK